MKKFLLLILLVVVLGAGGYFVYGKFFQCKKLSFSTCIDREFIYQEDGKLTDVNIIFTKDNMAGFAGVNRYFAGYKVEGDNIEFSPIANTLMSGPIEYMEKEAKYLETLATVNKVKVYKDKLVLITNNNKELVYVENKDYVKKEGNTIVDINTNLKGDDKKEYEVNTQTQTEGESTTTDPFNMIEDSSTTTENAESLQSQNNTESSTEENKDGNTVENTKNIELNTENK